MTISRKGFIGLLITEVLSLLDAEKDISIGVFERDGFVRVIFTIYHGHEKIQLAKQIDYGNILSMETPESYIEHVAKSIADELTSAIENGCMASWL